MKANNGFFDSIAGMIPCTPVAWYSNVQTGAAMLDLHITKTFAGYQRGEVVTTFARNFVKWSGMTRCTTILPFVQQAGDDQLYPNIPPCLKRTAQI